MPVIQTDHWVPSPDDSTKMIRGKPRSYLEIFQDLTHHLATIGYEPDEYLLLNMDLRDGALFPEDGYISQSVNFGGSEGIYLDATVHWEDKTGSHKQPFFTGKTLGTGIEDMNRMHLIASATLYAFHGHTDQSRYMVLAGEDGSTNGLTIQLDSDERAILADALSEARAYQKATGAEYQKTESLLRRVVGSITGYMQLVGEKPTQLSDFDTAVLSIKENNLEAFHDSYTKVSKKQHGQLFLLAAAQPGRTGELMTEYLMMDLNKGIPHGSYLDACKSIVNNGEADRLKKMLDVAHELPASPYPRLFGDVVAYTYSYHGENVKGSHIAADLIRNATEDEIKTVPPSVVVAAIQRDEHYTVCQLLDNGLELSWKTGEALYAAAAKNVGWFVERLVKQYGVDINAGNHAAMRSCMNMTNLNAAKVLINHGADFTGFVANMADSYKDFGTQQFLADMETYYGAQQQAATQEPAQEQSM